MSTFSQLSGIWNLRTQSQAANAGTWGDRVVFLIGSQDADGIDFLILQVLEILKILVT